jgi:hypothetical protein
MKNKLQNLKWKPRWVSHLGCVKGCLEYLDLNVSDAWLFGGTGHAFIINMHEAVCPSGPTAWMTEMLGKLGYNLGYVVDCVFGMKSEPDFSEKQQHAWEHVRQAIDGSLPCYGWELEIPEFYVVYGYDDGDGETVAGYYYSGPGCDAGKGPKAWRELGNTEIGIVEMYSVKPGTAADDAKTVKEALAFALKHAGNPEEWIFPKYKSGLVGFDAWIKALENGVNDGFGVAYNAAVWSECRGFAVLFLEEAKARLGDRRASLFDEALRHYTVVSQNLNKVAETFPFHGLEPEHILDRDRRLSALESLRAARVAEASGLEVLERVISEL